MREILFRGKRIFDNGQWVEGCLLKVTLDGETWHLIFGDDFQRSGLGITAMQHAAVNPETVGQYTGLKDKNGKRIFEGDIVEREKFGGKTLFEIAYELEIATFIGVAKKGMWFTTFDNDGDCFEVIGNIHDNPELLEVR